MNERTKKIISKVTSENLIDGNIVFSYNNGKGHFEIKSTVDLFKYATFGWFRDFMKIVSLSDDSNTISGYLNSKIKTLYPIIQNEIKENDLIQNNENVVKGLKQYEKMLINMNEYLVKHFGVSPLIEEVKQEIVTDVEVVDTVESNENITPLKRCNVVRFIPTQVKPLWENGAIETHVGYNFEYRGMPLQVYRMDGWERTNSTVCRIFIVDPVIGLPVTSYDGMLSELEDRLSQVFIGYLKTIESNKEAIVQIARAFKALKAIA